MDVRPRRDLFSRRRIRERVRSLLRISILILGDLAGAAVALVATLAIGVPSGTVLSTWVHYMPVAGLLVVGSMGALGTYGAAQARRDYHKAGLVGGLVVVFGWWALGWFYPLLAMPPVVIVFFAAGSGAASVAVRHLYDWAVRRMYRAGFGRRRTLIIGDHATAWEIIEDLKVSAEMSTQVVGHLTPNPASDPIALGGLDQLGEVIEEQNVWAVIVSGTLERSRFREVLHQCLIHGTSVSIVPEVLGELPFEVSSEKLLGWPLIKLEVSQLHFLQVVLKRTTDIALSFAGMVLLSPVYLAVALAVRLDSPGPILFRQQRLGVAGRPFTIFKFRSMRTDAESVLESNADLHAEYVANDYKLPPSRDPRVTRVGSFLRRTSLDELPQLYNVLKGEMSLVGPRPIVPDEIENYGAEARVFLAVKPGLTGYWQINGRSDVGYPERADLDIQYIENWSLLGDIEILLKTIPSVFSRDGAH